MTRIIYFILSFFIMIGVTFAHHGNEKYAFSKNYAYKIGDTTYDYLYPTWPAKILVPIAFTIWALRLFLEIFGFLRMILFKNLEPIAIPIMKTPEELANEEIKVIKD